MTDALSTILETRDAEQLATGFVFTEGLAFGGPDLRTLFFTARTSLYTLRVTVPGQPHPWYRLRSGSRKGRP